MSVTTTRRIDEVKKGLECCIVRDPDDRRRCPECPYRDPEAYCANRLMADALGTIETLSETIDALTSDVECESCKIDTEGENTHE